MSYANAAPELMLDAWPILEWMKGREPTLSAFRKIVDDAIGGRIVLSMCRMNHGEVLYSASKSFPTDRIESALLAFREIPIVLYSVDDLLVDEAVELKSIYSISYADAFAAPLAMRRNVPLVTGDAELLALEPLEHFPYRCTAKPQRSTPFFSQKNGTRKHFPLRSNRENALGLQLHWLGR